MQNTGSTQRACQQGKDLDFLAEVYKTIIDLTPAVNLLIVGGGPYFSEFKKKMKRHTRVYFAGRVDRESLPAIYSASDLLIFPGITDTFGMVVLEAQSHGLPAIVSDVGGPMKSLLM